MKYLKWIINKLIEHSLFDEVTWLSILIYVLCLVIIVFAIYFLIKYFLNNLKDFCNSFMLKIKLGTNYLDNFGWVGLASVLSMIAIIVVIPKLFPIILLLFIVLVLLMMPMKLIYILVGGSNSLSTFFLLFLLTQLLFFGIYNVQIAKYDNWIKEGATITANCSSPKQSTNDPYQSTEKETSAPKLTTIQILHNTFHIALTQQSSHDFQQFIDSSNDHPLYSRFFIIINLQIFLSWLYLGVLIANLYNKVVNQ